MMNTYRLAIVIAKDVLFDDDSDEDDNGENILAKVHNYAEEIVPNMTDNQFKMHFRISPETFEDLLRKLHSVIFVREPCRGHPDIPLEKKAMICIWCLANPESFRSVADRFGISKSTCWDVLYKTCRNILAVNNTYKIICWPSRERAQNIIDSFYRQSQIPGILRSIDGSHIPIIAPKEHHVSYINRKGFHSVLLQGICDHRKLFIDVYAGQPGSIHDSTLFQKSDIYQRIRNGSAQFPNDSHIIGDLAYKLTTTTLVGFKDFGNLTARQKNYNNLLSKVRVVIEHSYALLKGRFRRLKYLETVRLDLISLLIVSGCILHNLAILCGDSADDLINLEDELVEERANNLIDLNDNSDDDEIEKEDNNRNPAIAKRLNIVNSLPIAQK